MELFVIIANDWNPLTIITKSSILAVAAVLDPSLDILLSLHIGKNLNEAMNKFGSFQKQLEVWETFYNFYLYLKVSPPLSLSFFALMKAL